jgi:hypothetical protein
MDRKLFDECRLVKNLPKAIVEEIETKENEIPSDLFDKIFESEELKRFMNSPVLPKVEEITKKSILAAEFKKKIENIANKKTFKSKNSE